MNRSVLRGQAVRTAEEEHAFLDRQTDQQHGQTIHAQTEATVRRAAVLEKVQIELDVLAKTLFIRLRL